MFNLGSSYFHVALTTVRHLLNVNDTSLTSPLQGHLTALKVTVTVCHTAEHYGEEYDD